MKPKQAKETMIHVLRGGNTPLLIGGTGLGKSAVVSQMAYELADGRTVRVDKIDPNKNEFGFIDFRLSLYESVDLGGLCYIEEGKQLRAFLGNLPIKGEGILFLDEYGQAPQAIQAVAGQLIYERRIGEYTMPEGWQIVCASNRASDRAGSNKLPSHVIGRCSLIEFEHDFDNWLEWAIDNDVHPHVMGYLQFQPHALNIFDPKVITPQPSPRSWVRLSDTLKTKPQPNMIQRMAECDVGEIQSIDFSNFVRTFNKLPNIEAILNGSDVDNPYSDMESIKDKKEKQGAMGVAYATTIALSETVSNANESIKFDYFDNALNYVSQYSSPEYKIFFVRMTTKRNPELMETSTYAQFKVENQDVEF